MDPLIYVYNTKHKISYNALMYSSMHAEWSSNVWRVRPALWKHLQKPLKLAVVL